jgi:hypothetical protein
MSPAIDHASWTKSRSVRWCGSSLTRITMSCGQGFTGLSLLHCISIPLFALPNRHYCVQHYTDPVALYTEGCSFGEPSRGHQRRLSVVVKHRSIFGVNDWDMRHYSECEGLTELYFEDSWVLSITSAPGTMEIVAELVLREGHPDYCTPLPGEAYCYKRGRICFTSLTELHWVEQGNEPAVDASGEVDYGSLDVVEFDEKGWVLLGDFGKISLLSPTPPSVQWES